MAQGDDEKERQKLAIEMSYISSLSPEKMDETDDYV